MANIIARTTMNLACCTSCDFVMDGAIYEPDCSKVVTWCSNFECNEYRKRFTFPVLTVELTALDE